MQSLHLLLLELITLAPVAMAQGGAFKPCYPGTYQFPQGNANIQCGTKVLSLAANESLVNQLYTSFQNCAGGCINATATTCCLAQFNTKTSKCAWVTTNAACGNGPRTGDAMGYEVAVNANHFGGPSS